MEHYETEGYDMAMGTGNAKQLPANMTDKAGRCLPAYMTDGEIKAEMAGETDRSGMLIAELQHRRETRRKARANAVSRAAPA
jgi:hypothetical protein